MHLITLILLLRIKIKKKHQRKEFLTAAKAGIILEQNMLFFMPLIMEN